jgi:hypothetical protein
VGNFIYGRYLGCALRLAASARLLVHNREEGAYLCNSSFLSSSYETVARGLENILLWPKLVQFILPYYHVVLRRLALVAVAHLTFSAFFYLKRQSFDPPIVSRSTMTMP